MVKNSNGAPQPPYPWSGQGGPAGGQGSSLGLLRGVGDALVQGRGSQEQDVAFALLGLPELAVGAMETVQNSQHAKVLIEPAAWEEQGNQGRKSSTTHVYTHTHTPKLIYTYSI